MNIETLAATLDRNPKSVAKDVIHLMELGFIRPVGDVTIEDEIARLRATYGIEA